jgi:energy-converting hydrogenase Eha subunit B
LGASNHGDGVWGVSWANDHAGVSAINAGGGFGVWSSASGGTKGLDGVASSTAVFGNSSDGIGVRGTSDTGVGVEGVGGLFAGRFFGNVGVNGDLDVSGTINASNISAQKDISAGGDISTAGAIHLSNQDCAEEFDIGDLDPLDPGTVVVIDENGALRRSESPYDKKVAGIICGAGDYKPAIILGRRPSSFLRLPVARAGKVYCKADAELSPIAAGDLLTTSATAGHAMRADDSVKAFGAVIGKALGPLSSGRGLIPVLVTLQ